MRVAVNHAVPDSFELRGRTFNVLAGMLQAALEARTDVRAAR